MMKCDAKLITVGIADLQIAFAPDILRTILGSCVGICLYDKINFIGGLAHIMLPIMNDRQSDKKKYADTAIPILLSEMEKNGASKKLIVAKLVGGATMFKLYSNSLMSNIGNNNIDSVRSTLMQLDIKIIAEDLKGDYGRTIDFFTDTGMVKIRCPNFHKKII